MAVKNAQVKGHYPDGGNLWLQVTTAGTKSWVFIFRKDGKQRWMGIGPLHTIGLAEARRRAQVLRAQLIDGIDPMAAKNAERVRVAEERARQVAVLASRMTFRDASIKYIAANKAGWRNPKHGAQWESTLETYAYPVLGDMAMYDIKVEHVMRVLDPIWSTKSETASRVRSRIQLVWAWAKTRGHCDGDNPAEWKGNLDTQLPPRAKVARAKHHAALPIDDVPGFIADLRRNDSLSARALEFTILCNVRTNETIEATWDEFDLGKKVWTIPAGRMKAEKEHRVPLSPRACEILETLKHRQGFVFPGGKPRKGLSSAAMLELLKGMRPGFTVHGFRSTFRDWAGERTNVAREVIEHAMSHQLKDKAEAAYARGDLFDKRRELMISWDDFCCRGDSPACKTT
jgi:integrase